jgi:citrate lyase subunit beta / citryl-CoA lyase
MERVFRVRRSCLAVPASSERFIAKARGLPADEVFLDLEDAVAPAAKEQARANAAAAVGGGWGGRVVAVRVNDASTQWAHRDVLAVVAGDGRADVIVLPKVTSPDHVAWLDLLLGQVEREAGLPVGQTGIEAQIEDPRGLAAVNAIASASPRLEALVFGPADFMASVGIRSLDVGGQPEGYAGDVYHYALMRILIAARSHGLQAIDGPYLRVRDAGGFRRSAASAAALGYDGKWVLHPDQIEAANQAFAPSQAEYSRAEAILEAYSRATTVQARGAVMLGDEMIDEASRKMAQAVVARGNPAGFIPGKTGGTSG